VETRDIGRIGVIAAVYVVLTVMPPLNAISFGMVQVRVSEALTLLAYATPVAIPALFLGCFISNLFGGLGLVDVVVGSLATLLAAYLTRRMPSPYLAPLPPVLLNAVVVGSYLPILLDLPVPLWHSWLYVGAGEAAATYAIGLPILLAVLSRPHLLALLGARGRDGA